MTIICGPPIPRQSKRIIHQGDEARLYKLKTSEGILVERLQGHSDQRCTHQFHLPGIGYGIIEETRYYHFLKYQSLRLARLLFPENFVDVRSLHLSDESWVIYSGFARDEGGALRRFMQARKKASECKAENYAERIAILEEADKVEQELNPELEPLVRRIEDAGIGVKHPEAHYQINDGKLVFFEIEDLDFKQLLSHILNNQDIYDDALPQISLILACLMKLDAERLYADTYFKDSSLKHICDLVHFFLSHSIEQSVQMLAKGTDYFMRNIHLYVQFNGSYPEDNFQSPYPVDEEAFQPSKSEKKSLGIEN